MTTIKVTTVELVRLQRMLKSLKHDPYAAEKMHELIDTWLTRQENKEEECTSPCIDNYCPLHGITATKTRENK